MISFNALRSSPYALATRPTCSPELKVLGSCLTCPGELGFESNSASRNLAARSKGRSTVNMFPFFTS